MGKRKRNRFIKFATTCKLRTNNTLKLTDSFNDASIQTLFVPLNEDAFTQVVRRSHPLRNESIMSCHPGKYDDNGKAEHRSHSITTSRSRSMFLCAKQKIDSVWRSFVVTNRKSAHTTMKVTRCERGAKHGFNDTWCVVIPSVLLFKPISHSPEIVTQDMESPRDRLRVNERSLNGQWEFLHDDDHALSKPGGFVVMNERQVRRPRPSCTYLRCVFV